MKRVDFVFSKDWGSIKKGTKKTLNVALARSLQDVRKVGKIKTDEKPKAKAKPKAIKPPQDKSDKEANTRQTK